MGDMLRESNSDLASKVGVDEVEPPKVEASPDPADVPLPEETGGLEDKTADTSAPTAEELEGEQEKQKEETAAADADKTKAAEEQKTKDAAAAAKADETAAAAKTPEQEQRTKRDEDLKDQLSPHTHPKTRKVIEAKNAKIQEARDERDRIIAEREALKKERDELANKAKATSVPKEIDDELKTLRERVRELDITRDPQMEAKYDRPIAANSKTAVDLLKSFGADQVVDPKDNTKTTTDPRFEANLLKAGLTLKTLQPYIAKLEEGGLVDEAEQLREVVRENGRLARAKAQEVDSWKADFETRKQGRTQQVQQQSEADQKALHAESDTTLKAELAELAKTVPFINPPPAPLQTDPEPVRKAKEAALNEYNEVYKKVSDAVAAFDATGKTPEQARAASAKFSASAVMGIIARQHVIPRLMKDFAAKDARIKELETQLGKIRGASALSKQHATLASAAPAGEVQIPAGATVADGFAAFAKAAGVNVNS